MDVLSTGDVLDKAHRTNIERLVEEFGAERAYDIRELYDSERKTRERTAKIKDFSPIFVYRKVRESLKAQVYA